MLFFFSSRTNCERSWGVLAGSQELAESRSLPLGSCPRRAGVYFGESRVDASERRRKRNRQAFPQAVSRGSNRIFCPLLLNKKKRKGKVERKTTKKKACRVDNETSSANGGDSSMIHRARGSECRSLFWHRPARARRRSATKRRGARESLEQRHGFVAGKSPRATVYNRGVGVR